MLLICLKAVLIHDNIEPVWYSEFAHNHSVQLWEPGRSG